MNFLKWIPAVLRGVSVVVKSIFGKGTVPELLDGTADTLNKDGDGQIDDLQRKGK